MHHVRVCHGNPAMDMSECTPASMELEVKSVSWDTVKTELAMEWGVKRSVGVVGVHKRVCVNMFGSTGES